MNSLIKARTEIQGSHLHNLSGYKHTIEQIDEGRILRITNNNWIQSPPLNVEDTNYHYNLTGY